MGGKKFVEKDFRLEADFEKMVKKNFKTFFGEKTSET